MVGLLLYLALAGFTTSLPTGNSAPTQSFILLPQPTGVYQVGRSVTKLTDHSRQEIFAPKPKPVQLMISVFYPVISQNETNSEPYFPLKTAKYEEGEFAREKVKVPRHVFERLSLNVANHDIYQNLTHDPALVLFLPAEDTTRLFYSQIASTVASNGYIVVTIDPPYDVDVVEYPDGSLTLLNQSVWNDPNQARLLASAQAAIKSQVQDVSFVLDSLSDLDLAHSLVPGLPSPGINTTHAAIFGHSIGGATAYSAVQVEDRLVGGIDMDGTLFGKGLLKGTNKPFFLMGHSNHTRRNDPEQTWQKAWEHLSGWKRNIRVLDTQHYDFSDIPLVLDTVGVKISTSVRETLLLGHMEGKLALKIVTSYVTAFMDFVLLGKSSALLDGPVKEFPQVVFDP